jgi:hypothetical protein
MRVEIKLSTQDNIVLRLEADEELLPDELSEIANSLARNACPVVGRSFRFIHIKKV